MAKRGNSMGFFASDLDALIRDYVTEMWEKSRLAMCEAFQRHCEFIMPAFLDQIGTLDWEWQVAEHSRHPEFGRALR